MAPPRFYIPQLAQSVIGCLEGAEAKHATQVLRLSVDDQLCLFDGRGAEAIARVVAATKHQLQFEVVERVERDRELAADLTLAIALPKGDRQRTLIDAATELGVTRFVPLRTQRGVAQPTDNALHRLERAVIEACKQCGRNRLMEVYAPRNLSELITMQADSCAEANNIQESAQNTSSSAFDSEGVQPLYLVAHPYDAGVERSPLYRALSGPPRPVTIAIGPEGGFTNDEVIQLATNHWQPVDLGPTILRVEIAAIAAVAQIAAWLRPELKGTTHRIASS